MRRAQAFIGAGVLALALTLGACVGTTTPTQSVTGFWVGPTSALIVVGDTVRITANMSPADLVPGGLASVTWRSTNVQVATVANGLVKGVGAGQTTIVAAAGQYQAAAAVRVVAP